MKMKRSKIDVINATVESYLKRRHYQVSLIVLKNFHYQNGVCMSRRTINL